MSSSSSGSEEQGRSGSVTTSSPCTVCAGLAVYTNALAKRAQGPTCFGVRMMKDGRLMEGSSAPDTLPPNTLDYTFACLGLCAASDSRNGGQGLPRCQGVQLLRVESDVTTDSGAGERPLSQLSSPPSDLARPGEADAGRSAEPSTSGASADAADAPRPRFSEALRTRVSRNLESMQATLNNEGAVRFHAFVSVDEFKNRLWEVGVRNTQKLEGSLATASRFLISKFTLVWQSVSGRGGSREGAGE